MSEQLTRVLVDAFSTYRGVYSSNRLQERAPRMLVQRYEEGLSRRVVGQSMGLTAGRIRQIEAKALRVLRHPSRREKVLPVCELCPKLGRAIFGEQI